MHPCGFRVALRLAGLYFVLPLAISVLPRDVSGQPSSGPLVISTLKPSYVSAGELLKLLGATDHAGVYDLTWDENGHAHHVQAHPHETANQIVLFGDSADLDTARRLAQAVDLPPRQIQFEATIVEIDRAKARDAGIDWQQLWDELDPHISSSYSTSEFRTGQEPLVQAQRQESKQRGANADFTLRIGDVLRVVDERGIGHVKNTPRILTLNNRPATLLDGQRVTYISRASGVANIIETQTMDAGLKLEVRPSLGDTGYLLLEVKAELTTLVSQVSDSPVKSGQILENSIVIKDGETVLLGGFQRVTDRKRSRRVPLLGRVLPFLFRARSSTSRRSTSTSC